MRRSRWASKRNKKRLRNILIVLLLLGAILLILVFRSLGSPSEGNIIKSPLDNSMSSSREKALTRVEVSGEYISFEYLDSFRSVPAGMPVPPQLETFNFVTKNAPFWELSLGVRQLESGKLIDDGSYNLRATNLETFKKEQLLINDQWVTVFSDTRSDFSKVGFIARDNMLLSVALSGSGDKDKMQKQLKDILSSIKWKQ